MKNSFFSKYFGPLLFCWFWLFCFMLPQACTEDNEKLNRAERKLVDSIVLKETKLLRKEIDSICDADFEREVQFVVDSVLVKRREDIRKIMGK